MFKKYFYDKKEIINKNLWSIHNYNKYLNQRNTWDNLFLTCWFLINFENEINNHSKKEIKEKVLSLLEIKNNDNYIYLAYKNQNCKKSDWYKCIEQNLDLLNICDVISFNDNKIKIENVEIIKKIINLNDWAPIKFLLEYIKFVFNFLKLDFNEIINKIYGINNKKDIKKYFYDLIFNKLLIHQKDYNIIVPKNKEFRRVTHKYFHLVEILINNYEQNIITEHAYNNYFKNINNDIYHSNHQKNNWINELNFLDDINQDDDIETQQQYLLWIRKNQNLFRKKLLELYKYKCLLSDIECPELLVASHIVPWKLSNDMDRLNPYNGFLLIGSIDKLFDKFYISIKPDDGTLFVSKAFRNKYKNYKEILEKIGILKEYIYDKKNILEQINILDRDKIKKYLSYHYDQTTKNLGNKNEK